ncbi:hypothetical protein [Spirosoma endbachense]|uniref:Uncharacterized protein n=1 Tax=Spirosoma endbachense TaxID=2666025 RepID=A0A6P1VZ48_9BACT|nr:hypothetical protein [Spirosoma endbachense]QHV96989.1 hypothetical protein GJR95_19125 [Spirosoma endbachense]
MNTDYVTFLERFWMGAGLQAQTQTVRDWLQTPEGEIFWNALIDQQAGPLTQKLPDENERIYPLHLQQYTINSTINRSSLNTARKEQLDYQFEDLLMDETFVRWAKQTGSSIDNEYWSIFTQKCPHKQAIVALAIQFITFLSRNQLPELPECKIDYELQRLFCRINNRR